MVWVKQIPWTWETCLWQYSEGWNLSSMPAPIFVTRPFILTQLPQHLAEEFGSAQDYFHWLNNLPNKIQIMKFGIQSGTKLTKESLHCFFCWALEWKSCYVSFLCTSDCSYSIFSLPPTLKETPYCCLPALIMQQEPFVKNIEMVLKLDRWSSRPLPPAFHNNTSVILSHIFPPWTAEAILVCPPGCAGCSLLGTSPECQQTQLQVLFWGLLHTDRCIMLPATLNLHSFSLSWLNSWGLQTQTLKSAGLWLCLQHAAPCHTHSKLHKCTSHPLAF